MTGYTSGKVQHNDPKPMVNYGDDGVPNAYTRHPRYSDCSALCRYAPRPEFDNHNPILVWLRAIWDDPECGTHAQILDYMRNDVRMIGSEFSPEERAHARRVLTKMAALTTTPNGVTD